MQPEDIDALLDKANQLLEAGKPEESLRHLDEMIDFVLEADDRIEWASLRAWALTELGREEEALETLDHLLDEFPRSSRLLSALGVVFSNTDHLEDARDALEEAVAQNPDDEVSLANLALVYERLREYERAISLYDQALDLGADVDWILQRKAATLTEIGDYGQAKSSLKRYLSLAPEDASQWIALAVLHSDEQEYVEAADCYKTAQRIEPMSAALCLNWGVTAVRAGDLATARAQLDRLREIEASSSRPELLEAFILEEEGDIEGANKIYGQVIGRAGFSDRSEQCYAYEMAMDFYARREMLPECQALMARAYAVNACTVELCEAYRDLIGQPVNQATWYSVLIEADYRTGLQEVHERGSSRARPPARFLRAFQVVASDHDEAVGLTMDFARQMGETNVCVREFVGNETIADTHTGIYEVEAQSFVFADEPPDE